jgi:Cysteine-rich secretory protein family
MKCSAVLDVQSGTTCRDHRFVRQVLSSIMKASFAYLVAFGALSILAGCGGGSDDASCGSEGSFPSAAPLAWNAALTQASLVHSDDMVAANFVSHTGSDGSSAGQRATAAGYVWQSWGENIAAGQPSVAAVMAGWMASPGHCANIMHERLRDIGVACVSGGASNTYRTYWTMTLGLAR